MAEFEKPKHGEICWQELNTKDLGAAEEFYKGLFNWEIEQAKTTPMTYKEIHFNEKAVGGMMEISEGWGENWQNIPSAWRTYIAVDDIAESVEKIKQFGGGVCVPPFDAPNVGKISLVNDPSGITFSIIQFV
ncbi:MAG TPA: VOC family protein [Pyrinomonadaceae bacterium]|nr:VOC family protein [Pyrinomonadaceae bacterium]